MSGIVVIGAGQAGSALCAKLRGLGYEGDVTLIGAEADLPYQRPPLSKAYLLGEMERERLYLRPAQFYADQNITLRLGSEVTAIDPVLKTVTTGDEVIGYEQLALTTGSTPRRLPAAIGGDLPGVHVVRGLSDIDTLQPELRAGARALVIGGGYIGLEAAAVLRKLELQVTVVEAADRILQRVAAPETSEYFRALHRGQGVDIREGVGLARLTGDDRVTGAELADGTVLEADLVIVGIGILPGVAEAEAAGLAVEHGIVLNALGQTSDTSIWAAGDCAIFPYCGAMTRLESVQNAIDQAEAVAANMLGAGADYVPQPWFWSDQYDVKLQIAGLNTGYDAVHIRAGDKPGSVSHWYYAGAALRAVDAMNDPRAYMIGKRLLEAGTSPDPAVLCDPAVVLKTLL